MWMKNRLKTIENENTSEIELLTNIENHICDALYDRSTEKSGDPKYEELKQLTHNRYYHLFQTRKNDRSLGSGICKDAILIRDSLIGKLEKVNKKFDDIKTNQKFMQRFVLTWLKNNGQEMCEEAKKFYTNEQSNYQKISVFITPEILKDFLLIKSNAKPKNKFLYKIREEIKQAINATDIRAVASYLRLTYSSLNDFYQKHIKDSD